MCWNCSFQRFSECFFLSYETMVDLLIINTNFPTIGSQLPHQHSEVAVSLNENYLDKLHSHDDDITCYCLPRSKVPNRQNRLPFEATSANMSKIVKIALLKVRTFNV